MSKTRGTALPSDSTPANSSSSAAHSDRGPGLLTLNCPRNSPRRNTKNPHIKTKPQAERTLAEEETTLHCLRAMSRSFNKVSMSTSLEPSCATRALDDQPSRAPKKSSPREPGLDVQMDVVRKKRPLKGQRPTRRHCHVNTLSREWNRTGPQDRSLPSCGKCVKFIQKP